MTMSSPDSPGIDGFTPREAYILWSLVKDKRDGLLSLLQSAPASFSEQDFLHACVRRYSGLLLKMEERFDIGDANQVQT